MFEITRLEGEHSCHPKLTQDQSQLDSNFMSIEIQNMVKVDPSVIVALLRERINQESFKLTFLQYFLIMRKRLICNV